MWKCRERRRVENCFSFFLLLFKKCLKDERHRIIRDQERLRLVWWLFLSDQKPKVQRHFVFPNFCMFFLRWTVAGKVEIENLPWWRGCRGDSNQPESFCTLCYRWTLCYIAAHLKEFSWCVSNFLQEILILPFLAVPMSWSSIARIWSWAVILITLFQHFSAGFEQIKRRL
jgi:hypothetical protein